MKRLKDFGLAASGVATRGELEHRIAARPKPRAGLHLTPQGWEAVEVRRQIDLESERRIRHLRERLEKAHGELNADHAHALRKGRAKQDFDRER